MCISGHLARSLSVLSTISIVDMFKLFLSNFFKLCLFFFLQTKQFPTILLPDIRSIVLLSNQAKTRIDNQWIKFFRRKEKRPFNLNHCLVKISKSIYVNLSLFILVNWNTNVFLVAKATLQSQMSICLSVQYQNPAASQNHAYWHNLSLPQPL